MHTQFKVLVVVMLLVIITFIITTMFVVREMNKRQVMTTSLVEYIHKNCLK